MLSNRYSIYFGIVYFQVERNHAINVISICNIVNCTNRWDKTIFHLNVFSIVCYRPNKKCKFFSTLLGIKIDITVIKKLIKNLYYRLSINGTKIYCTRTKFTALHMHAFSPTLGFSSSYVIAQVYLSSSLIWRHIPAAVLARDELRWCLPVNARPVYFIGALLSPSVSKINYYVFKK